MTFTAYIVATRQETKNRAQSSISSLRVWYSSFAHGYPQKRQRLTTFRYYTTTQTHLPFLSCSVFSAPCYNWKSTPRAEAVANIADCWSYYVACSFTEVQDEQVWHESAQQRYFHCCCFFIRFSWEMVQSCYLDAYFTQDTYIWQPVQSNCQSHMALIVFVCQEVVVPVLAFAMRAALDLLIMVAAFWKKKKKLLSLSNRFHLFQCQVMGCLANSADRFWFAGQIVYLLLTILNHPHVHT